jgi:hypothetical protein
MPEDRMRLRAHLAHQRHRLEQLEAIEQAEDVVRHHHDDLLAEELVQAQRQLRDSRREVRSLQAGDQLARLLAAEEKLRAAQHKVANLQRRCAVQSYASLEARRQYVAQRRSILRGINHLQHLLRRGAGSAAPAQSP